MAIITLYITLFLFAALLVNLRTSHVSVISSRQRLWSLEVINILRHLIETIPKHRGMVNAFLLGDVSFKDKISNVQKIIDQHFSSFTKKLSKRHYLVDNIQPDYYSGQWNKIKSNAINRNPADSFVLHTKFIKELIEVMEDIAERANLYALDNKNGDVTTLLIEELPMVAESLGQARGIGAGVIAQRYCSAANRVKLNFLYQNARDVCSKNMNNMNNINKDIDEAINKNKNSLNIFLDSLKNEVIETKNITINSDDYYAQGTAAIENNFQLFDSITPLLENTVKNYYNGKRSRHLLLQSVTVLAVILIVLGACFIPGLTDT